LVISLVNGNAYPSVLSSSSSSAPIDGLPSLLVAVAKEYPLSLGPRRPLPKPFEVGALCWEADLREETWWMNQSCERAIKERSKRRRSVKETEGEGIGKNEQGKSKASPEPTSSYSD
jgi:hypothetical protein